MGNVKAREGWDEAHLGASSQATKSTLKDAAHATCDLGDTCLTSCIKVCVVAILFPCRRTNTEIPYSKTALESDASDEGSIIDHDQEGVVSDKEGIGINSIEEGMEDDSNDDTHSIVMPTLTNSPSMDPFINSHATSMLKPFMDNNNTTAASAMSPSNKPCSAPTDFSTSQMEPFLLTSEPTRAGRKRKCRDMSNLSLCLCGISVQSDSVGSIRCQRAGCETVWVSNPFLPPFIEI